MTGPLVAVADLHGNKTLFARLLERLEADLGDSYRLVTLGDYVDNGPEIPALLDLLVALQEERPGRFFPILGNHDLACLRTVGYRGAPPSEEWYRQWHANYINAGGDTAAAYGARSAVELREKMPAAHRAFLEGLPWFEAIEGHVFVHAGLHPGPIAPQLEELSRREPMAGTFTHDQLRSKQLAVAHDPAWEQVVVSGHTKEPVKDTRPGAPHFVTARRITLSSEVDRRAGKLFAVVLPERRLYVAEKSGLVERAGLLPFAS